LKLGWHRPVLSLDDIRREAADFLEEYHEEGTIPVPIEEIVEFDFQLDLIPVPGIKDDLRVDAFLTSDRRAIYIDEYVLRHVPNRYRFSLAHELGHYWLHEDLYSSMVIRSVADYRRVQDSIGAEDYRWLEWQAHAFAGLVLVPSESLKQAFDAMLRKAYDNGLTRTDVESYPARQRLVHSLAKQFEVSEDVMEIRLEKDGLLPPLSGRTRD
jgi:Zn-dependent peptidase ImmA (M78 family)